jgi:leucyl aminopeptidase
MSLTLAYAATAPAHTTQVFLLPVGTTALPPSAADDLPEAARTYVESALADEQKFVVLNHFSHQHYFVVLEKKPTPDLTLEALRKAGHQLQGQLKKEKTAEVFIHNLSENAEAALTLAEGLFLSAYEFEGYKTDEKSRKPAALTRITLVGDAASDNKVTELQHILEGVVFARDLVNAPLNKLNAQQLAERFAEVGDQAGYTTDILDMAHIESLRPLSASWSGSPKVPRTSARTCSWARG